MKRVPNHQFLYLRGHIYHFRRVVPPEARAAFDGRTEVKVSLGTRELAEARHLADAQLKEFDRRLSRALGRPDPTLRAAPALVEPSVAEIDAAVRLWLEQRNANNPVRDYSPPDRRAAGIRRLKDLGTISNLLGERLKFGGSEGGLQTEWIAEAITQQNGWLIDRQSPGYRHLLRTVARGEIEAAHREVQEINGEPRTVRDATFGPDQYRLDAARTTQQRRTPIPLLTLFDAYVAEAKPAPASIKAWKPYLVHFTRHLGHDDAARVKPGDVIAWKDRLLVEPLKGGQPRSAKTINDGYLVALKTVLKWAAENQRIPNNPAATVRVRVPKQMVERERGLNEEEALAILKACVASHSSRLTKEAALARRWVPWICAYTGARVNEVTQLRAEDVRQRDGVWCIHITPEAGTVKNRKARWVPLHSHLVEQGFMRTVEANSGPLFYDPVRYRGGSAGNPQSKKVGERLAKWVRSIGVNDIRVAPNHGWRHRFKTVSRKVGIAPETRDAIQGHRPRTEGEDYGDFPVSVLAEAIEKLPRYDVLGASPSPIRKRSSRA